MSGSFYYGLKARFYGMLFQLPWSFFVTICCLLPILYVANVEARALLLELTVYWTVIISVVWLVKDIRSQKILPSFKINGQTIQIFKNEDKVSTYSFEQIEAVRPITRESKISRSTIGGTGVLLKFDDGHELPVLDQIVNYNMFNVILRNQIAGA